MAEVGRPTQLDDEFCLKIKTFILDGYNHKSICEILDINYDTWQGWITRNYNGFTDKLTTYRHERMLQKGEANLETLMDAEDDKIKLQASIHVTETLGKRWYSKKNETDVTSGGKPLTPELTDEQFNRIIKSRAEKLSGEESGTGGIN